MSTTPEGQGPAEDSDDSDAEGGLGNVTRVVIRPPGHSGKAKRGHLSFDASFETGNLGRIDFISEFEYDLFIRPDTCNPRHRLWFNFVVDNVRQDQRVLFNIVNFSKPRNLFSNGMTPLVRTSSRPRWQRLDGKYVYYHKSPEHRNHYILSFAFVFDREDDVYQFALTFPYSYARLDLHLTFLQQKNHPWLNVQTLAHSLQHRKVQVYSICNPNLLDKKPKVVVAMSRIHPGESPTSYVAQGLIDFLLSSHPLAVILRDHVLIKVIPMICPDGVFHGNQRSSVMGYDLNRHWNQISSYGQPVLAALKNYLQELDRDVAIELDMIFDLHAHMSLLGAFIYGNSYEDVYRFERHILFPKILAHNAEDYNSTYTMFNCDPHKAGTARRHLCETLRPAVNVYTLQVSAYGYTQQINGVSQTVPYNEDSYFRLGRNLARTLCEYYRVRGIIPAKTFSAAVLPDPGIDDSSKKKLIRRSRSRSRPRTVEKSKSLDAIEDDPRKSVPEMPESSLDEVDESWDEGDCIKFSPPESPGSGFHETDLDELDDFHLESIAFVKGSASKSAEYKKTLLENTRKLAFQTFDFSALSVEGQRLLAVGGEKGRKVGGGGVLGKRKSRKVANSSKWVEPKEPLLTIIDFNELIRIGVAQRIKGQSSTQDTYKKVVRKSRKLRAIRGYQSEGYSGGDDTSSDSEYESQFVLRCGQRARSPPPLHNSRTAVHHERMQLNPRERRRRGHVKFNISQDT